MRNNIAASALILAFLATAGSAFAQRYDPHENRGRSEEMRQGGERRGLPDRGRHDDRHRDLADRGAGPRHDLRRGGRLPEEYRHRQYVVDDWRGHRLSPPPRGYQWVQVGGDYVLISTRNGIIANIVID